jgi:uncharacterized protein YqgC (DUF456 family)
MPWYQAWGIGAVYVLAGLLCLAGIVISCLSLSGTWFVAGAAILIALVREDPFPGFWTVVIFLAISGFTEAFEFFAGAWGVTRRGGSKSAGAAAVIGGVVGLLAGTLIPVPIVGNLIGMLAGSFLCAYVVERWHMKRMGDAASIAFGAVMARVSMILVKTLVALGMAGYMFIRILAEG